MARHPSSELRGAKGAISKVNEEGRYNLFTRASGHKFHNTSSMDPSKLGTTDCPPVYLRHLQPDHRDDGLIDA